MQPCLIVYSTRTGATCRARRYGHAVRAGAHSAQVSALARTLAQARQAQAEADTLVTPG